MDKFTIKICYKSNDDRINKDIAILYRLQTMQISTGKFFFYYFTFHSKFMLPTTIPIDSRNYFSVNYKPMYEIIQITDSVQ